MKDQSTYRKLKLARTGAETSFTNTSQKFTEGVIRKADDSIISEEHISTQEVRPKEDFGEKSLHPKLLRITRPFRTWWDLVMMVLAIYTCFTVPFFLAFYSGQSYGFFVLNTLVDLTFMVDIYFNFFTSYIDVNGDEVMDIQKIRRHYLRGTFALDLLASLPIDNFVLMFGNMGSSGTALRMIDLLKMLRIMRLGRIIRFTRTRDDIKGMMKLLQLTLYLIIWIHLTGCEWFIVVRGDEEWVPVPDFMTGETRIFEASVWRQLVVSLYHGLWLLVGGEVGPRDTFQSLLASVHFILGAMITAVLFGEIAVLMTNLNKKQTQFQAILDGALTTMKNMELEHELLNEILDYITQTQNSLTAQEEYETFIACISPSLQQKVSACIYEPIISKNKAVNTDKKLKTIIMHKLKNIFTKPEEEIIVEGAEVDGMYFLVRGECKVFVNNKENKREFVTYLCPGSHFGEIGILYKTVRTASIESNKYCNVAQLTTEDYYSIVSQYPNLANKFKECIEVYEDPWREFMKEALRSAHYFEVLPDEALQDLAFYMKRKRYPQGKSLFKPGHKATKLYFVRDGRLEIAMTVNEKHLFLLKKEEGVKNMEPIPRNAKKKNDLSSYSQYKMRVTALPGLKRRAEIVPALNADGQMSCFDIDDEPPDSFEPIGDYPQEIVVANPEQGALINSHLFLLKWPCKLQCKTVEPSTVYTLNIDIVNNFCKNNPTFRSEVAAIKSQTEHGEGPFGVDYFDYSVFTGEEETNEREAKLKEATRKWKYYAINFILYSREQKKKNGSAIVSMVSKLKAIVACQEVGNEDLEQQVLNGEVPPQFVTSDGELDEAGLAAFKASEDEVVLTINHPILKAFRESCQLIRGEDSEFKKAFDGINNLLKVQNNETENLVELVEQLKGVFYQHGVHSVRSGKSFPPESAVSRPGSIPIRGYSASSFKDTSKRSKNLLDSLKK